MNQQNNTKYRRIHGKWHETRSMAHKRGIGVVPEWENDFDAFYAWMIDHGFETGMKLVRIDKTLPYGPNNCELFDPVATYYGKTLNEWADEIGIALTTLYKYMSRGYDLRSLSTMVNDSRRLKEAKKNYPELYSRWHCMIANAKHKFHHDHVGWERFLDYYDWCIANGWKKGMYVVRKDPKGLYTPENCEVVSNRTIYTDFKAMKRSNNRPKKNKEEIMEDQRKRQNKWYWEHRDTELKRRREAWKNISPEKKAEYSRKRSERIKKRYREDPEYREHVRERAKINYEKRKAKKNDGQKENE